MPTFAALAAVHEQLLELLLRHQEALIAGDVTEARERFRVFAAAQLAHRTAEDEFLLPRFLHLPEAHRPGGSVELLEAEHRKLGRLVVSLQEGLAELDASAPLPPRERIAWIERERMLKELLDHHDQRERAVLFPALDCALEPGPELEDLWSEIRRRHELAGLSLD